MRNFQGVSFIWIRIYREIWFLFLFLFLNLIWFLLLWQKVNLAILWNLLEILPITNFFQIFHFLPFWGISFRFEKAYRNSWTLDAKVGRWTLDARLWTLDTVVRCSRTESKPSFWSYLIKLLKFFQCESLRTMVTLVL